MTVPPPISVTTLLTESRLDLVWALAVVAAAALYLAGVRRLAARGRAWPGGRTAWFLAGLVVVLAATCSGVAAYEDVLFSAHVVQHLLLAMVAPMFLALGAPITLALQASRRTTQVGLLDLLGSRVAHAVGHPVVAWIVFGGSLIVLYTTPLYELSLRNGVVHGAVHVHFLLSGCLFFWAVVGMDRSPVQLPHPARLLLVLLAIPFHAFVAIALLSSDTVLAGDWYESVGRTWGASPLHDQRTGAGLLWAFGDLLSLGAGAIVLLLWMQADDREAARADRRLDRDEARRRDAADARSDGAGAAGAAGAGGTTTPDRPEPAG